MKKIFHTILQHKKSISKMLLQSYQTIIAVMAVPTVIMIIVMLIMTARYDALIDNIDKAATMRDLVRNQFTEEIWNIVSGKKDFSDGQQYQMIDRLDEGLQALEENSENASRYVVASRRANDTLRTYADTLHTQIQNYDAVSLQEGTYRDITGVVALTHNVLEQYINEELIIISGINKRIQAVAIGVLVLIILILMIVILFAADFYSHMKDSINKPILQLEEMTREITEGNLDARVSDSGVEELIPLTSSLNYMAGRLQQLIDERLEVGQNLQKAEMRALQAQITPHFIYNTLGTIIWLAEQNRNQEVVDITMSFTDFLRISLSQGADYITVGSEQKHVQSYLSIQSERYRSIMTYDIDIDATLSDYHILKLLLQPLVENAIYHGIKNKRGGGHIHVSGHKNSDYTMTFKVEDNGIGMREERLEKVLHRLKESAISEKKGFGLYNVNRRIRLYYNRELNIESEYGKGTSISFTLPCGVGNHD